MIFKKKTQKRGLDQIFQPIYTRPFKVHLKTIQCPFSETTAVRFPLRLHYHGPLTLVTVTGVNTVEWTSNPIRKWLVTPILAIPLLFPWAYLTSPGVDGIGHRVYS